LSPMVIMLPIKMSAKAAANTVIAVRSVL
jgi:hypothetical protein